MEDILKKLKDGIIRLKKDNLIRETCSMEIRYKEEAYNEILQLLDSSKEDEGLYKLIMDLRDQARKDMAWEVHVMICDGKSRSEIDHYVCEICDF